MRWPGSKFLRTVPFNADAGYPRRRHGPRFFEFRWLQRRVVGRDIVPSEQCLGYRIGFSGSREQCVSPCRLEALLPRYFFDLHDNGEVHKDDTGSEFANLDDVRAAAMLLLPDIAREGVPRDGDYRSLVVFVTDENERPIYSATLSCAGLWLRR
jgi:hypothetical protein